MSIKDLTITDQNVQSTYVQSQPDRLTGTAQQNKAAFDAYPALIRQRFNQLLEALAGTGGAGEIPVGPIEGVTAENVQQALEAIQQNLTAYINKIKSAVGASEVGVSTISGIQAKNVQKALEELRTAIDNIVSGIIPGGSITTEMLADDVKKTLEGKISREGEQIPLGTDILTLAPGRYYVDGVPGTDIANSMNLPITTWHYEIDVIATSNAIGLINNYKIVTVYPIDTENKESVSYRNVMSYGGEWTGWVKIPTATPPKVRNLTLQDGFTANGDCTFFVTQEGAVFLSGGVSGTILANQDTQIGTLPADASPSELCRRTATTNIGAAYIEIRTDGTVWARPVASASQCWFDASFVAGGGS